jgi:hypothetical protein
MFWWANFFSITLHISGRYRNAFAETICNNLSGGVPGLYVGVHEDQWHHHFEENNYLLYDNLSPDEKARYIEKSQFIKLALKFDLSEWNRMPLLLDAGYEKLTRLMI